MDPRRRRPAPRPARIQRAKTACFTATRWVQSRCRDFVLGAGTAPVPLRPAQMIDGPWCPDETSANRWDADLLRIRRVRVTVRVEAALASLRGPAGVLFANGGSAAPSVRWAPDQADPIYGVAAQPECEQGMRTIGAEDGIALMVAMMALLVISALGSALILLSSSETIIAAHFRDNVATRYAVDATSGRHRRDRPAVDDWVGPITGATRSAFVDGPPAGRRTLPDGSIIDLAQLANLSNCRKTTGCTDDILDAVDADHHGLRRTRVAVVRLRPVAQPAAGRHADRLAFLSRAGRGRPSPGTHRLPPADGGTGRRWKGLRCEPRRCVDGAYKAIEVVAGRSVETPGDENDYNPGAGAICDEDSVMAEMRDGRVRCLSGVRDED